MREGCGPLALTRGFGVRFASLLALTWGGARFASLLALTRGAGARFASPLALTRGWVALRLPS